jgi:hypothetical protein
MENELTRNCPKCNQIIFYKKREYLTKALKKNCACKSCKTVSEEAKKNLSEKMKGRYVGDKNPFFGKKHTQETKEKISNIKEGKKLEGEALRSAQESLKRNSRNNLKVNNYNLWVQKYGEPEAKLRKEACAKKHSKNNSGAGNPMFGKPAPQGSGNGWSGWYKGWYFRSLLELSFMVNFIEKFNLEWKSGEVKSYSIKYKWMGKDRTYFPDFVIASKYLIECKPTKLMDTQQNRAKMKAAQKFCQENGMKYKVVCPEKLTDIKIIELYNSGTLKFLPKYEIKYKERLAAPFKESGSLSGAAVTG